MKKEDDVKILLLSRYDNLGASSRYRSYQYLPHLRSCGFEIDVAPLLSNAYLQRLYSADRIPVADVVASYVRRKLLLLKKRSYDLIWIEYEAFPWVPAWMELILLSSRVPFVLDYDDAIFHRYDRHSSGLVRSFLGRKIDRVMSQATLVVAGNEYLASRAREAGARRVEILPTVIDLEKYPLNGANRSEMFTIGWIGTPKTVHYLNEIREALQVVCKERTARLVTIGATGFSLPDVPGENKPWSDATEVQEIQKFDVGVMPLVDGPWERGKCGHKLIQYMGCGKPVVASPVGVNSSIVDEGKTGLLASTTEEWVKALNALKQDEGLRLEMGRKGRAKVESRYSLQVTAPLMAALLNEAGGSR